jgi:uncharacterized protein YdeI (YjbR/CyaY-like superfamily)
MGIRDKRIDAYIKNSADFAKPVLNHLRELVHKACPDVAETIKWGFPNFEYKGVLCSMAAFKEHCAFNFWKVKLMNDPYNILEKEERTGMGVLGRIKSISELPKDKIFLSYIKEAVRLNDEGVKIQRKPAAKEKKELSIPDYFMKALKKDKKALKTFENFSYSHKKEYVEWVTEAKTEETRNKRLSTAVEWMAEGKGRNWKYVKC